MGHRKGLEGAYPDVDRQDDTEVSSLLTHRRSFRSQEVVLLRKGGRQTVPAKVGNQKGSRGTEVAPITPTSQGEWHSARRHPDDSGSPYSLGEWLEHPALTDLRIRREI